MRKKRLKETSKQESVKKNGIKLSASSPVNSTLKELYTSNHGQEERNPKIRKESKEMAIATPGDIFPRCLPWILFPLLLSLRIMYVLEPTNWWILHPDEIFQTMEVAHTDAFGYGFRPYEYLPPPEKETMNSTTLSDAHKQEIELGMYSLRSFILPKLLALLMVSSKALGIDASPFLIIKVFHVVVTSLLPIAVFQFSQRLHRSRDIGCLSAILVSTSTSLNVFGTHTIINSFLSPFVFITLVPLVESINTCIKLPATNTYSLKDLSYKTSTKTDHEKNLDNKCKCYQTGFRNGNLVDVDTESTKNGDIGPNEAVNSSKDENANEVQSDRMKLSIQNEGPSNDISVEEKETILKCDAHNVYSIYQRLDAISVYELVSGIILAICVYIRVDLILIPISLGICFSTIILNDIPRLSKHLSSYILGFVFGILIGGYCDYVTYGKMFTAPFQWYTFNVLNGSAGRIFGTKNFTFYILQIFQNEPIVMLSLILIFIDFAITIRISTYTRNTLSQGAKNQSLLLFLFILLAFTLNGHKELRFIHNAIVFMYIALARAIISLCNYIKTFIRNQNNCQYSIYATYLFIILFTSSHFYNFLNVSVKERKHWAYAQSVDSHETNICLDFIRQQTDVTGVSMDRSLQISGAYSVLHHDVPIFALNIFEYIEYRKQKTLDKHSRHYIENVEPSTGYSTFSDISDFISVQNAQYLLKALITNHEYNYLILNSSQNFHELGYKEVFRIGKSKVVKRGQISDFIVQRTVNAINNRLNATVLEHEGERLKHFGVFTKAEERLILANRVDPKRLGVFRLLLDMYRQLNVSKSYKTVLDACVQLYKPSVCLKPHEPVLLQRGYYRKSR